MVVPKPAHSVPSAADADDLLGRDEDLQQLELAVRQHRLVTLTGPGGVGKTRLARALVARRAPPPILGFCELAPVQSPDGVPAAIAEGLGFPSLPAAVVGLVDRGPLLAVVDDAEHHLDAVAVSVEKLLVNVPGLRLLVTSQAPLELPDERVVVLDALRLPAGDHDRGLVVESPAVQLFLARAQAAGVRLVVDDATAATIAAICERLDGLPLAIELAAARARSLSPADILRHLDARFELLARRRARGLPRHRSLEAAIDWSVERLDPPLRRFFIRLGAFYGSFSADAAHQVAGEPDESTMTTLDRLDTLVTRSLIGATQRGSHSWYRLPESMRLYARRRLEDAGELMVYAERCADCLVPIATDLAERAQRSWSMDVSAALLASQLAIQDAIRWCLEQDEVPTRAFALFAPSWAVVHNARADAVLALGEQLLARWDDPDFPGWSEVAATTASAAVITGDAARGRVLAERALGAATGGLGAVLASRASYLVAVAEDDEEAALDHAERAVAAAWTAGLRPLALELEVLRGLAMVSRDGLDAARDTLAVVRAGITEDDGESLMVDSDIAAAALAAVEDPTQAAHELESAVARSQRVGYPWGTGAAHRALGACALATGDLPAAADHLLRSLELLVSLGHLAEVAETLRWAAGVLAAADRPDVAAEADPAVEVPSSRVLAVLEPKILAPARTGFPTRAGSRDLRTAVAAARRGLTEVRDARSGAGAMAAPHSGDIAGGGPDANRWAREGEVWSLTFGGTTVRLPEAKGLADLAVLIARPHRELAATELMGSGVASQDLGPTIDANARRAYEARIIDLQDEMEEAERFSDLDRAQRAHLELDQLIDQLSAATGLAGRGRRVGGSVERARSAVTWRIRDAIRRIAAVHPELGAHLQTNVSTGRFCVYRPPDGSPAWTVEP